MGMISCNNDKGRPNINDGNNNNNGDDNTDTDNYYD